MAVSKIPIMAQDELVAQSTFQRRTQQRRQMAMTMANQATVPNSTAIKKAWEIIRREGDRLQMVEYPMKKYGGARRTRVVRPGVPTNYQFKTKYRIEQDGRTPMWDMAKRISGKRQKDSIISNARGVRIAVTYQGDRARSAYRPPDLAPATLEAIRI